MLVRIINMTLQLVNESEEEQMDHDPAGGGSRSDGRHDTSKDDDERQC
jgi:hypothetical protein